jgi:hypothetical protein
MYSGGAKFKISASRFRINVINRLRLSKDTTETLKTLVRRNFFLISTATCHAGGS